MKDSFSINSHLIFFKKKAASLFCVHLHVCIHTDFGCHLPHSHTHRIRSLFCPYSHKVYCLLKMLVLSQTLGLITHKMLKTFCSNYITLHTQKILQIKKHMQSCVQHLVCKTYLQMMNRMNTKKLQISVPIDQMLSRWECQTHCSQKLKAQPHSGKVSIR